MLAAVAFMSARKGLRLIGTSQHSQGPAGQSVSAKHPLSAAERKRLKTLKKYHQKKTDPSKRQTENARKTTVNKRKRSEVRLAKAQAVQPPVTDSSS